MVRVVMLNAWGGAIYEALVEWLPHCGADILCVQEVTHTPGLSGFTTFEDHERRLRQRADLFADIEQAMPNHFGFFAVSDSGPVGSGGSTFRQDFGIAMFVHRRFTVTAHNTEFVHGSYISHSQAWPTDRPRIAQAVRLYDHNESRALTVTHFHGLRDPFGKGDTQARLDQAHRLSDLVQRTRSPDDLVIVGGDMNLLPSSETFAILSHISLTDLVGRADTRTSLYKGSVRHASYLLVSSVGAVRTFEILETPEVSDHRVLRLDI